MKKETGKNKAVSELNDEELIGLMYEVLNEVEARLKYRSPVELTPEEMERLPF